MEYNDKPSSSKSSEGKLTYIDEPIDDEIYECMLLYIVNMRFLLYLNTILIFYFYF